MNVLFFFFFKSEEAYLKDECGTGRRFPLDTEKTL